MRAVFATLFVLSLGCGGTQATASPASSAGLEERPLDWAMLLPIETDGLVRLDIARIRRSPHRASLEPVLTELFDEVGDAALQGGIAALIDRTDVVMIAMLPPEPGRGSEVLVLARGNYRPDEIERLEPSSFEARTVEVEGRRVWIAPSAERAISVALIRPDTLALTASLERMEALIARMRMTPGRRWPPSVRALVEATGLERSTFGVAFAEEHVGVAGRGAMSMSVAGTADADGPLDVSVVLELGDPGLAASAAMLLEALVREIAGSARGESFALGRLADLARIETTGTQVRGTIHADANAAQQLVPGLMGLLRDGLSGAAPELPAHQPPIML